MRLSRLVFRLLLPALVLLGTASPGLNSAAHAEPAPIPPITGTIAAKGADIWHDVSIDAAGVYIATLEWDTDATDLNLFVADTTREIVAESRSRSAKPEVVAFEVSTTGIWRFGVRTRPSDDAEDAAYTLTIALDPASTPPPPLPAPAIVADTFTTTPDSPTALKDGRITEIGDRLWEVTDGASWGIQGEQAARALGTPGGSFALVETGTANGHVEAVITLSPAAAAAGLVFRATDADHLMFVQLVKTPTTNEIVVQKKDGVGTDAFTSLFKDSNAKLENGKSYLVRVELADESIKVFVDDVERAALTESYNVTATRAGIQSRLVDTTGVPGANSDDSLSRWDDFEVGAPGDGDPGTPPPPPPPPPGTPPAGAILKVAAYENENGYHRPSEEEAVTAARQFDLLISVAGSYQKHLGAMRAANPDVKVIAYMNAMFAQEGQANAFPEDWYMRDASGRKVQSKGYMNYLMNGLNPGWVQSRRDTCLGLVSRGYDGCMLDLVGDAPLSPGYVTGVPVRPDGGAWNSRDYLAMTSSVQAEVQRSVPDKLVIGNGLGSGARYWDPQAPSSVIIDGPDNRAGLAEGWIRSAGTPLTSFRSESQWKQSVDVLVDAANKGKIVSVLVKIWVAGSDAEKDAHHKFTLASFLLGTDGNSYYSTTYGPGGYNQTTPHAWYDLPLGAPRGPYAKVGGVYQRKFENGQVVVNPTTTTATVDLGTQLFDTSGMPKTSVTLAPNTSELLLGTPFSSDGDPVYGEPPPAVIPEVPVASLLALAGIAVCTAVVVRRRRTAALDS